MSRERRSLLVRIALLAGLSAAVSSCRKKTPESASAPAPSPSAPSRPSPPEEPTTRVVSEPAGPLDWLALGGGPAPESTEVSIENDIDLARRTLRGNGFVLFAGGGSSLSVRELQPHPEGDALLLALGDLFHPRPGRSSRYRRPSMAADRATLENVEARLDRALSSGKGPLLLYVAAHGDQGKSPRENLIALWGNQSLTAADLAEIHERHERPLRVVMTSCFAGGFAELAFAHAEEARGPSRIPRCGLFAGPWDRQTSGCDANPDRRSHDSYGVHFLHALRGEDRAGKKLEQTELDFDGDGAVGLLDAHTRARIAAASFDVPTTTSERYLRKVEHGTAKADASLLPEEAAVVRQLGRALGLETEAAAGARWESLDAELGELDRKLDAADEAAVTADAALGVRLLERWPVLDDPYRPDFARALSQNRAAIAEVLDRSAESEKRAAAHEEVAALEARREPLELEEARVSRLLRSHETLRLAAALAKRGGSELERYRTLLACERAAP